MGRIIVCETCNTYTDENGLKHYNSSWEVDDPDQYAAYRQHVDDNPDHIVMIANRGTP